MASFAEMAREMIATGEPNQAQQGGQQGGMRSLFQGSSAPMPYGPNRGFQPPQPRPAPPAPGVPQGSSTGWKKPEFLSPAPQGGIDQSKGSGALGPQTQPPGPLSAPVQPTLPPWPPSSLAGMFQMLIGGGAGVPPGTGAQSPPLAGGGLPDAGVPLPSVPPGNAFDTMVSRYGAPGGQFQAPGMR